MIAPAFKAEIRPCCYWLTGLSGAGKSTLAQEFKRRLDEYGLPVVVLDGDELRQGLNAGLGFSREDRAENVRRIAHVAKLFVEAGLVAVVSVIAPYREDRAKNRQIFNELPYFEVFVDAPLGVCQKRDPKGLYARHLHGFTGVSAPYEVPQTPDIRLSTDRDDLHTCVEIILRHLTQQK